MEIPLSYENHLSTCRGWDFNQKIGTRSIFQIGPFYTNVREEQIKTVMLTMIQSLYGRDSHTRIRMDSMGNEKFGEYGKLD